MRTQTLTEPLPHIFSITLRIPLFVGTFIKRLLESPIRLSMTYLAWFSGYLCVSMESKFRTHRPPRCQPWRKLFGLISLSSVNHQLMGCDSFPLTSHISSSIAPTL